MQQGFLVALTSVFFTMTSANVFNQYLLNSITAGMDPMTRSIMRSGFGADLLDLDMGPNQNGGGYGGSSLSRLMPRLGGFGGFGTPPQAFGPPSLGPMPMQPSYTSSNLPPSYTNMVPSFPSPQPSLPPLPAMPQSSFITPPRMPAEPNPQISYIEQNIVEPSAINPAKSTNPYAQASGRLVSSPSAAIPSLPGISGMAGPMPAPALRRANPSSRNMIRDFATFRAMEGLDLI